MEIAMSNNPKAFFGHIRDLEERGRKYIIVQGKANHPTP